LHGRKPGRLNGLVDLGYAYFLGSVSDDTSEAPLHAIGTSMSDAAVANAAQWVGLGASLTFLLTRTRRYLPQHASMEIDLGRVRETAAADRE